MKAKTRTANIQHRVMWHAEYVSSCAAWCAESWVTGRFADKPTRVQSSRGLVNSPKCLIQNLEYIIALSVISSKLH